ncbi:hypothetical protein CJ197_06820 [Brachybacterium sp. UMB0905]|nr:hypothetical protein CJ197_06820 [Brachybacterium sp. UMB0905]
MAPGPATVWEHLVARERLPEWLGTPLEGPSHTPGTLVIDHGDGTLCTSTLLEVDPGEGLAMTWQFPEEPETRLEVHLHARAGTTGTVLELVHRGLGELTDSYGPGWTTRLTFFEASLEGSPLPLDQFWNLWSTVNGLGAR